ncbi:MAG TPA: hypothetical protein VKT78_04985 [Fimbriimonadaceae bacterium]|nr:hypothetical protein [Fimbriimonadaceae bacterium]
MTAALSPVVLAAIAQQGQLTSWDPLSGHRHGPRMDSEARAAYLEAIQRTAEMAQDPEAARLAGKYGLNVLNLTWEDTGRYKNSAVGPNISDMTIQVGYGQPDIGPNGVRCMPVVRYPNFSDKTCDIDPSDFTLLVGNEHGQPLKRVSLREFLEHPTEFLSKPESWLGSHKDLLAARDSKVLVSAQACFLPVPKSGQATFNPVLFNYLSSSGNPAVLTVLATREGTSTTIIDNKRDSVENGSIWGQRLFHNADGERASLTGERLSDFRPSGGEISKGAGLSMVLLIQIPLKHRSEFRALESLAAPTSIFGAGGFGGKAAGRGGSDVEAAVIGHGDIEGPFTEIDHLAIQRDPNLPVRVTVQFYKATSNGVVSGDDMKSIKHEIDRIYDQGENVGSLVVDGETGRPTEYVGNHVQPAGWWNAFWERYEENMGISRAEAIRRLRKLLGNDYQFRPVSELYLRNLLRG